MSEAAFMFSGGLDSTAGAVRMLERFDRVHLMTWKVGAGFVFTRWSRKSASALSARFPGRVVHHIEDATEPFDRIVKTRLVEVAREYRSRFVWCLGCKMSMHIAMLRFCKEHGLDHAGDGSASDTEYYVEQMPVSLAWIEAFYHKHGVDFLTPAHGFRSRQDKLDLVSAEGLPRGRTLLGRNPGTQPFCLAGNALYFSSTVFNAHPSFDPQKVERFLADNEALFDALVQEPSARSKT